MRDDLPLLFPVVVGLTLWGLEAAAERRRQRRMQSLAMGGMEWLDRSLPEGFPVAIFSSLTPWYALHGDWKARNVVAGVVRGDLRLAFDLELAYGRNSLQSTVVACRSRRPRPMPVGQSSYRVFESGEWRIVAHKPKGWLGGGLLELETIRLIWKALE